MGRKVLLIDDDVETFLDFLISRLNDEGFDVIKASSLTAAMKVLKERQDISASILDIMFPLREDEDAIYEEYMDKRPTGPEDAMQAGLALIPAIVEESIPILVLTNLSRKTRIGSEVHEELDKQRSEEKIVGVWLKPPDDSFFEMLKKLVEGRQGEGKPQ